MVAPGQLVPFTIAVFNQGDQDATDIVITDAVPDGMTFDAGDNPGWALVGGNPTRTLAGPLVPGDDAPVTIKLARRRRQAVSGGLVNTAEISAATSWARQRSTSTHWPTPT